MLGVVVAYVLQQAGWQRGIDAAPRSHAEVSWLVVVSVGVGTVVLSQLRSWGAAAPNGWAAALEPPATPIRAKTRSRLLSGGVRRMPAASGTDDTPTQLGLFYLTELLEPSNLGKGPYAYGLSGFTKVLGSSGGGSGQIGMHGADADTYLAELLPTLHPIDVR